MDSLGGISRSRTTGLAVLVAALTTVTAHACTEAAADVGPPDVGTFGALLTIAALGALAGCGLWALVVLAALLASHRDPRRALRLCPRRCRPLVLALCGAGISVALAAPSVAAVRGDDPLPPLGRVSGHTGLSAPVDPAAGRHPDGAHHDAPIVVRAGDSLWSIVAGRHPSEGATAVARRVDRLYRGNADRIGHDPDLVRAGLTLRPTDLDPGERRSS